MIDVTQFGPSPQDQQQTHWAFVQAIAAAALRRSEVFVPAGFYPLSAPLDLPAFVTIRGEGLGSRLAFMHDGDGFVAKSPNCAITTKQNIALRDLWIESRSQSAGTAVTFAAVQLCKLSDCILSGWRDFVTIEGSYYIETERVLFRYEGTGTLPRAGVWFRSGGACSRSDHNILAVRGCSFNGPTIGIQSDDGVSHVVENNHFNNTATPVLLKGGQRVRYVNNYSENAPGGAHVVVDGPVTSLSIVDSYIVSNGDPTARFIRITPNGAIHGLRCEGNHIMGAPPEGAVEGAARITSYIIDGGNYVSTGRMYDSETAARLGMSASVVGGDGPGRSQNRFGIHTSDPKAALDVRMSHQHAPDAHADGLLVRGNTPGERFFAARGGHMELGSRTGGARERTVVARISCPAQSTATAMKIPLPSGQVTDVVVQAVGIESGWAESCARYELRRTVGRRGVVVTDSGTRVTDEVAGIHLVAPTIERVDNDLVVTLHSSSWPTHWTVSAVVRACSATASGGVPETV